MKAILVIDVDNIDIENTQATYIELQCDNTTIQMALLNHWLKPMPQKKEVEVNKIEDIMHTEYSIDDIYKQKYIADIRLATDKLISLGYNGCLDEILGDTE